MDKRMTLAAGLLAIGVSVSLGGQRVPRRRA